ncbi:MAG: hypothetical protein HYU03_00185, partial [Thaumarchaeota archaeon]|nr:hypothetical protein [Nitrososphaerota archaeon]
MSFTTEWEGAVRTSSTALRRGTRRITINRIAQRHEKDNLDVVKLEPLERHGFYGWLARSLIPGFKVKVKPVSLAGYNLVYLLAPEWGYNCPPVNGFLNSHNLSGTSFALIITYTKGDVSGYSARLARKVKERGANLIGSLALKRREALSEWSDMIDRFLEEVSQHIRNRSDPAHQHEIVFIGMTNVNRDG